MRRHRTIISFGPGRAEFRERWRRDRFAIYQTASVFILTEMTVGEQGDSIMQIRGTFASFSDAQAALDAFYWPDSGGQSS